MSVFVLKKYFLKTCKVQLLFILLSIVMGTASFYFMNAFIADFQNKLVNSAKNFSSSDIRIESLKAPSAELINDYLITTQNRYDYSEQIQFPTMIKYEVNNEPFLVNIKAVENSYPNYGVVLLKKEKYRSPESGTCYIAKDIFERYGIQSGHYILMGEKKLKVIDIIDELPDQNMLGPAAMIPTVLVSLNDAKQSGLLQWGSRIIYLLLLKAKNQQIKPIQIEEDANRISQKFTNEKIQVRTWQDAQNMGRTIFERTSAYFNLLTYGSVILSAVGFFLALFAFVQKVNRDISLLYCIGLSRKILFSSCSQLLLLVIAIGSIFGLLTGMASELIIKHFIQPDKSYQELFVLHGFLCIFTLTFCFSTSGVLVYTYVRQQIYHTDSQTYKQSFLPTITFKALLPFLLLVAIVLFIFSGLQFGVWLPYLYLLALIALLGVIMYALALMFFWLLRILHFPLRKYPLAYLLDVEFFKNKNQILPMFLALALGSVLLIGSLNTFYAIESKLNIENDQKAHNVFLIDIQKDQKATLQTILDTEIVDHSLTLSPLIRANLLHINHVPLSKLKENAKIENRVKKVSFLNRSYNLTYKDQLNNSEKIVDGFFWSEGETKAEISLEKDFATTLGVKLGDMMGFDIGGLTVEGVVTSVRSIEWGSMNPNFFVVMPTNILTVAPQTMIASCHIPSSQLKIFQNNLNKRLSNVSIINLEDIMKKMIALFGKIKGVLMLSASMCFVSAIIIFLISILANYENATNRVKLLYSIGLNQTKITILLWLEKFYFVLSLSIFIVLISFCWAKLLQKFIGETIPIITPALIMLLSILIVLQFSTMLVSIKKTNR